MNKEKNCFRKVSTLEEANEIKEILEKDNISVWISKDEGNLDVVLSGEVNPNKFEVLIEAADREKAEYIFLTLAKDELNHVPTDYYLFSFTDDELQQVIIEKDEWNEFDILLSEKILNDRGVKFNSEELKLKQEDRKKELSKPEGGQLAWLIFGYIFAFGGGFIGLLLGYNIWQAKNKLPDGSKVYAYNENVRKHGKIIFIISLVIFPITIIIKILNNINSFV